MEYQKQSRIINSSKSILNGDRDVFSRVELALLVLRLLANYLRYSDTWHKPQSIHCNICFGMFSFRMMRATKLAAKAPGVVSGQIPSLSDEKRRPFTQQVLPFLLRYSCPTLTLPYSTTTMELLPVQQTHCCPPFEPNPQNPKSSLVGLARLIKTARTWRKSRHEVCSDVHSHC